MYLDYYQTKAKATASYPEQLGLAYTTLGLNGEAGEVAELVKKMYRDDEGVLSADRREKLKKELGDCLWYIAMTATEVGFSLSEIAKTNLDKLADRKEREVIKGDGDDR